MVILLTGIHGTTAFCKLAVNLPVSDNDVSGMKILDMRPAPDSFRQKYAMTELPRQRIPPIVVMLDALVSPKNYCIAIQACSHQSIMDLKMSHVTFSEMRWGEEGIQALLSCFEVW